MLTNRGLFAEERFAVEATVLDYRRFSFRHLGLVIIKRLRGCRFLSSKENYWPQLDGLRSIAFFMVFFHHHGAPVVFTSFPPAQALLGKTFEWGWLGVDLFFILSAFLVTHLLCSERQIFGSVSLPKFYGRRAVRIWPLYFSVLIAVCFVYPLFAPSKASHLYNIFIRDLVVPLFCFSGNFALPGPGWIAMENYIKSSELSFWTVVTFLAPFWSLCVEEQFYIGWGLCVRLTRKPQVLLIWAGSLALLGFLSRFLLLWWQREQVAYSAYYMHSLWHLETIMLGSTLALLMFIKPNWFSRFTEGILPPILMSACLVVYLVLIINSPSIQSWSYALAPVMTACSLTGVCFVMLALHWKPLILLLSNRWLVSLGKLTFGMYVFHFAATFHTKVLFGLSANGWSGLVSLLLCFASTLFAAMISWHVLEKPMNRLRKRLSRFDAPVDAKSPQGELSSHPETRVFIYTN